MLLFGARGIIMMNLNEIRSRNRFQWPGSKASTSFLGTIGEYIRGTSLAGHDWVLWWCMQCATACVILHGGRTELYVLPIAAFASIDGGVHPRV